MTDWWFVLTAAWFAGALTYAAQLWHHRKPRGPQPGHRRSHHD